MSVSEHPSVTMVTRIGERQEDVDGDMLHLTLIPAVQFGGLEL